jgi:hypothetical protein
MQKSESLIIESEGLVPLISPQSTAHRCAYAIANRAKTINIVN